jgi:undecaprenyl-diphosphatase
MSVVFYGLLIFFVSIEINNKKTRFLFISILLGLIFSISFSRLYLQVHYTSDIIAGLSSGFIWLILSLIALAKYQERLFAKNKI